MQMSRGGTEKDAKDMNNRQLTQLNAAQDRDLQSRLSDSPRLTMGNKRKARYLSQQGTPSNYTTVQNHSPPSPFSILHPARHPRPGKLKEKKAEHAISEAGLLFRERSLQEPPKRHRHEVPQPGALRASCNPLGTSQGPGLSFPICQRRRAKEGV